MNYTKLKRDFLAAMPVIGPHNYIQAELMIAGVKPVAWLHVSNDFSKTENKIRLRLDKAVEDGKLISADVLNMKAPEGSQLNRFFAQPNKKNALDEIIRAHEFAWNGIGVEEPHDYGELYGYRRRDRTLYNILYKMNAPDTLKTAITKLTTAYCLKAYQDQLLERHNIERFNFDEPTAPHKS